MENFCKSYPYDFGWTWYSHAYFRVQKKSFNHKDVHGLDILKWNPSNIDEIISPDFNEELLPLINDPTKNLDEIYIFKAEDP